MKIELVRKFPHDPTLTPPAIHVDMPNIPRVGECIIFGDIDNFEVKDVIYRLDDDYKFTGRVTIEMEKIV